MLSLQSLFTVAYLSPGEEVKEGMVGDVRQQAIYRDLLTVSSIVSCLRCPSSLDQVTFIGFGKARDRTAKFICIVVDRSI